MKKIVSLLSGSVAALAFPSLAFAQVQVDPCPANASSALCSLTGNQFGGVVQNVITFFIVAAVIIAVIFLIWGGIQWILSGGDKSKVENARNSIIGAIVGLIIVFLAYFIISVVAGAFGVDMKNLTLPKIIPNS